MPRVCGVRARLWRARAQTRTPHLLVVVALVGHQQSAVALRSPRKRRKASRTHNAAGTRGGERARSRGQRSSGGRASVCGCQWGRAVQPASTSPRQAAAIEGRRGRRAQAAGTNQGADPARPAATAASATCSPPRNPYPALTPTRDCFTAASLAMSLNMADSGPKAL